MVNAPDWWFVLSGICFAISILFNIAFIMGGMVAWRRLGPVINDLQVQVRQLGATSSNIVQTAKSTVDNVHDRAEQILGSAQDASAQVSRKVGTASAALTAVFVALRIFAYARGLMSPVRRQAPQIRAHS